MLDRYDKKASAAYATKLSLQEKQIATQKQDAADKRNLVLKGIEYGIDQATLSKMQKASSVDEAIEIASTKLRDPMTVLQLKKAGIDIQQAYATLAKTKQDAYYSKLKSMAELSPASVTTDGSVKSVSALLASNKVGAGTKTLLGTIFGVQNSLEAFAKANASGTFEGINPFNTINDMKIPFTDIGLPFRAASMKQKSIENRGYIDGINLKIQQWASGASLTDAQTRKVEAMTPAATDTDFNAKTKTNNLANFMNDQIRGALQSEGIQWNPEKIDLFTPQTLDGIMSQ
jgi:hypothetical protein